MLIKITNTDAKAAMCACNGMEKSVPIAFQSNPIGKNSSEEAQSDKEENLNLSVEREKSEHNSDKAKKKRLLEKLMEVLDVEESHESVFTPDKSTEKKIVKHKKIIKKIIRRRKPTTTTLQPKEPEYLDPEFTTTTSSRSDIEKSYQELKLRENSVVFHTDDNAKHIDEETEYSPFEDKGDVQEKKTREFFRPMNAEAPLKALDLGFQKDIDVEEAVRRLSTNGKYDEIRKAEPRVIPKEMMSGEFREKENSMEMERQPLEKVESDVVAERNEEPKRKAPMTTPKTVIESTTSTPTPPTTTIIPETTTLTTEDAENLEYPDLPEELTPVQTTKRYKFYKKKHPTEFYPTVTTQKVQTTTEEATSFPTSTTTDTDWLFWTESMTQEEVTEEPMTTSSYDFGKFFHTRRPQLQRQREKYLTFCTKDTALRDRTNMVIACGDQDGEWSPTRCPETAGCFQSEDATYKICCNISNG